MCSIYDDMKDSERQVADFLQELDLWWWYEYPIFVYDEKDRPRVWTPDYYIPKLGMYIEVCGSEKFDYGYREKIYKKNGATSFSFTFTNNKKSGRPIWWKELEKLKSTDTQKS